jgi:glycosyltransferase involved in cell wall biosynthesis
MPAYNAAPYIAEAVESVKMQTFTDWELVVVDDGSTDDTAAIVERETDPRVRLIRGTRSGLPAVARNHAISETKSELVAFLDADDVWLPEKLARQIDELDRRPDVGVVYCDARIIDEPDPVTPPARPGRALVQRLLEYNFIYNSSVIVRRAALETYGVFDPSPELRGSEDYELWLRLAPDVEFAYVPAPLLLYRSHEHGLSRDRPWMERSGLVARSTALARHPGVPVDPGVLRAIGIARCIAQMPGGGRRELMRAVAAAPFDLMAWKWLAASLLGARTVARLRRGRGVA